MHSLCWVRRLDIISRLVAAMADWKSNAITNTAPLWRGGSQSGAVTFIVFPFPDSAAHLHMQCDLGGRNRRCFRRAGRKFLELDGFLLQQCTSHFSLPAVEAGKRYAILCTPTFYALPTLFRCSDRLIPLLFPYCQCLLLHGVLLAASLYFSDCSQKYIFPMVLFSHFGTSGEKTWLHWAVTVLVPSAAPFPFFLIPTSSIDLRFRSLLCKYMLLPPFPY